MREELRQAFEAMEQDDELPEDLDCKNKAMSPVEEDFKRLPKKIQRTRRRRRARLVLDLLKASKTENEM